MKSRSDVVPARAPRVLIASTAMLAFITFWQAAAIVLNDMGSSAFYAGAISEHFVGRTAPWFVLAIMLLAGTVAALYIESCGMFVRYNRKSTRLNSSHSQISYAVFCLKKKNI